MPSHSTMEIWKQRGREGGRGRGRERGKGGGGRGEGKGGQRDARMRSQVMEKCRGQFSESIITLTFYMYIHIYHLTHTHTHTHTHKHTHTYHSIDLVADVALVVAIEDQKQLFLGLPADDPFSSGTAV